MSNSEFGADRKVVFLHETPKFGVNYDRGWIGFNHTANMLAKGITTATSYQRDSGIPVSHVFIVTGEDRCIEANFGEGVVESNLTESYFAKNDRYVVMRKPAGLTEEIAAGIVQTARNQLGEDFDSVAMPSFILADNYIGWMINRLFGGKPKNFIEQLVKDRDRWICSELAAYCLQQQPKYRDRGVLKDSSTAIEPQKLFEDESLFEPLETTLSDSDHHR